MFDGCGWDDDGGDATVIDVLDEECGLEPPALPFPLVRRKCASLLADAMFRSRSGGLREAAAS